MAKVDAEINVIHATLETIPQTILLLSFLSFHFLNFFTYLGRYPYSHSISASILSTRNEWQTIAFTVPILISFLAVSIKIVNIVNNYLDEILLLKQKVLLALYFLLIITAKA